MESTCVHALFIIMSLFMIGMFDARTTIFEWTRDHVNENYISTSARVRTVSASSKVTCSRECLDTTGCAGFFYNRQSSLCHIHSSVSFNGTMKSSPQTSLYLNVCMKFKYVYDAQLRKYYMCHVTPTHTQAGAEIACESNGGRLLSLSDETEFQAMRQILRNSSQINKSTEAYWVGAKVNITSGKFHWNDGVAIERGFWAPSQPQFGKQSNTSKCVLMMPIYDFKLDDYECSASSSLKIYPLCECDLTLL